MPSWDAAEEGERVRIFLERTPFYPEGGGQVGDQGQIRTDTGTVHVIDTVPAGAGGIVHEGIVTSGEVRAQQPAVASIDVQRREATTRAHTSTHVVHWTLKHLLGEHARQAGSLVEPGRLRFDFPNPGPVGTDLLEEAELEANRRLAADDPVKIFETTLEEATSLGAVGLFGEKYGDLVPRRRDRRILTRTVRRDPRAPYRERGRDPTAARGLDRRRMRRVEALVGPDALREINAERALLHGLVEALEAKDPQGAIERARKVLEENKRLRSELGSLRAGDRESLIASLVAGAQDVDGISLVVSEVPGEDPGGLRDPRAEGA
jgi:alanyl-tRNA synthetase